MYRAVQMQQRSSRVEEYTPHPGRLQGIQPPCTGPFSRPAKKMQQDVARVQEAHCRPAVSTAAHAGRQTLPASSGLKNTHQLVFVSHDGGRLPVAPQHYDQAHTGHGGRVHQAGHLLGPLEPEQGWGGKHCEPQLRLRGVLV